MFEAFASSVLLVVAATSPTFVRFGIVTDLHYADAPTKGTRFYRDSIAKLRDAVSTFTNQNVDFIIELGDFKDKDEHDSVNTTIGFLADIETELTDFKGARFHVLGNHDVDILTQSQVREHISDYNQSKTKDFYSFNFPFEKNGPEEDIKGCLVKDVTEQYVWIVHNDSTRNWISTANAKCFQKALQVSDVSIYPKRYHGIGHYNLNSTQSFLACEELGCKIAPSPPMPGVRFIVLNGDFNEKAEAWYDIDDNSEKFNWAHPWIPSVQLEWLAEELEMASTQKQKVIIFVHYRLDGGPGMNSTAWIDTCTLDNALVVRNLLENSGVTLGTFSGHDHVPVPHYTLHNGILYWTHSAMVEGPYSSSNSYSVVEIREDCSINIQGYGNASSIVHPGPEGCTLRSALNSSYA